MAKKKARRIGILTSGGDCPGLNAVIRAVTKKAILEYGYEVIGIKDGFEGLLFNRHRELNEGDVSGILTLGGTILGTTNRANPYKYPVESRTKVVYTDLSVQVIENLRKLKIDGLVCIGTDISYQFSPVNVTGLSGASTKIATGGAHTCAVLASGGLECWGYNIDGQVGDGSTNLEERSPVLVPGL